MRSNRPTHSPFDGAALDRLRRMGLAAADESVERDAMAVFCCIFAGQFYDDPVWWLSGSPAFAEAFADGFLAHLKRLNESEGCTP